MHVCASRGGFEGAMMSGAKESLLFSLSLVAALLTVGANMKWRAGDYSFSGALPTRIRHARRTASLTQSTLARQIGIGPSAVAQWELPDGTSPTIEHLAKIAVSCGVSFEWLATGRGAVSIAGPETSALEASSFAVDLTEERLLVAFRRVPRKKKDVFVQWLENFF